MAFADLPLGRILVTWRWRLLAACLILSATSLHFAYLACNCPLDLAPDEAHYWEWSRHLDWSYYSKGPLVAYLVRAGWEVGGALSERLTGTPMLGVRLPAGVCGSLLLISLYLLTMQVYGREPLALAVVALALTLPLFAAGSSLMTIDAPYTCCWGWALVLGYQAIFRRSWWAWPILGLVIGIGILAKYTMVLWVPSAGLFLLFSRERRRLLWQPGFWVMAGLGAACCLPIVIWNAQHGWVSLRHVNSLAGMNDNEGNLRWLGPLKYLGGQFAVLLGYWFVVWFLAMANLRPWKEPDGGPAYLWWMSFPMFACFGMFSLKTGGGELNWPVTAYLSGIVLGAAWLGCQLQDPRRWYRRLSLACLLVFCLLGTTMTVVMHHSEWFYPLLTRLSGPATPGQALPLRRVDPTCRLRGWRQLAAAVDQVRDDLQSQNIEPVLAGSGWSLAGEVAFYCRHHPTVYSLGLALGDRHSQYDFWRPNPVADPGQFLGRTFILVGGTNSTLQEAFDRIDPPRVVLHTEQGQPIAFWTITVCRGFHGFHHTPEALDRQPF